MAVTTPSAVPPGRPGASAVAEYPAVPRPHWWSLALPAAAFGLLLLVVAGTRHSGPAAVPPVLELVGRLRALLPAGLTGGA